MIRVWHALLIALALLLANTLAHAAPVTIVSGVTGEITLSKATLAIGEALGLDPAANRCNCML